MPVSPHGHHILLSPGDRTAIMNATSFDQIFVVLNQYWTFVQHELLEYVVQEYGNDELKEEMKRYIADMEELKTQVGIDRLLAVLKLCSPQPDSIALDSIVMEVRLSGSQHKLRDTRLVQRSMGEQCGLHPPTVHTLKADTAMYLPLVRKYVIYYYTIIMSYIYPLYRIKLCQQISKHLLYVKVYYWWCKFMW